MALLRIIMAIAVVSFHGHLHASDDAVAACLKDTNQATCLTRQAMNRIDKMTDPTEKSKAASSLLRSFVMTNDRTDSVYQQTKRYVAEQTKLERKWALIVARQSYAATFFPENLDQDELRTLKQITPQVRNTKNSDFMTVIDAACEFKRIPTNRYPKPWLDFLTSHCGLTNDEISSLLNDNPFITSIAGPLVIADSGDEERFEKIVGFARGAITQLESAISKPEMPASNKAGLFEILLFAKTILAESFAVAGKTSEAKLAVDEAIAVLNKAQANANTPQLLRFGFHLATVMARNGDNDLAQKHLKSMLLQLDARTDITLYNQVEAIADCIHTLYLLNRDKQRSSDWAVIA